MTAVVAQRLVAALLTCLLFALVLAIFVGIFTAAGHGGIGWLVGAMFCGLMAYGGWRSTRR